VRNKIPLKTLKYIYFLAIIAIICSICYETIIYLFVSMFAYRDLADSDFLGKNDFFKYSFIFYTLTVINLYSIYLIIKLIINKSVNKFQKVCLSVSLLQAVPCFLVIIVCVIHNFIFT